MHFFSKILGMAGNIRGQVQAHEFLDFLIASLGLDHFELGHFGAPDAPGGRQIVALIGDDSTSVDGAPLNLSRLMAVSSRESKVVET